jgi:hypothetical protein
MLEFNSGGKKELSAINSGLSSEQQQRLESQLKSQKEPVTFSQVSGEFDKGKNGNGGIIAAIVIVGVVLAVIIGVVIHNNKKRDY